MQLEIFGEYWEIDCLWISYDVNFNHFIIKVNMFRMRMRGELMCVERGQLWGEFKALLNMVEIFVDD